FQANASATTTSSAVIAGFLLSLPRPRPSQWWRRIARTPAASARYRRRTSHMPASTGAGGGGAAGHPGRRLVLALRAAAAAARSARRTGGGGEGVEGEQRERLADVRNHLDLVCHQPAEMVDIFDVELHQEVVGARDRVAFGERFQVADALRYRLHLPRLYLHHHEH